jgi:4-diphosphocytidyl-2-C-methyl-D-erythritol kinase
MKIYERASAKINLSLDVLRKREDGYHEVEMVMTMVDLADRLEMEDLERDTIILASQSGYIPLDEKNLAFQAAKLIKKRYNVTRGVYIHLDKHIPVAAGLAGGSSDAAATLRGLNRLWDLNIPSTELEALAAELGSDIPFCVRCGTAIARGRGENLQSIDSPPSCWIVLAKLPFSVSTADVYRHYDAQKMGQKKYTNDVLRAIQSKNYGLLCRSMGNALEEVTLPMHPQVRQLKELMLRLGVDASLMSGSGPTVFALVQKEGKAERVVNGLRGFCREVHAVRLLV